MKTALSVAFTAALVMALPIAQAAPVTECATNGICYCMNSDFKPVIDEQVAKLKAMVAAERAKGKAVGYMSVPLSTAGGSVFGINREVAEKTRASLEAKLGAASAWVLNPGMKEADIPNVGTVRASGAEYMVMWTRLLEGANGLGEDFDFIYFVGPSDFGAYFGLTGTGDLDRISAFYTERIKTDAELKRAVEQGRVTPQTFRNYYGLRASISFSLGAHDEWNIAARINAKRRGDAKFGVPNQLPTLFDGKPVSSAEAEVAMSNGYAGACKP
ncbi:MAG: hypothetical protein V4757_00275 [Pseudomonadota bacterium]